jgi:hypothetical protein
MKQLNLIVLVLAVLFAMACQPIHFTQSQPVKGKIITKFSPQQQGSYKSGERTVYLTADSILTGYFNLKLTAVEPGKNEAQVKIQNDVYFVNISESGQYTVVLAKFFDDKLALYMLNSDSRTLGMIERFTTVERKTTANGKPYFMLNPSRKEMNTLVDYDIFEVVEVYQKVN